ncbi:unnamed protein product [Trichogramma brassicae]|uniref:Uncharacterized protein n=1 Tax=Trichogramma brassicae TaxID=86971 RepID=A0A6H5IRX2_9HYME|nr:unnamed protein product [Trichogramma brassicae]
MPAVNQREATGTGIGPSIREAGQAALLDHVDHHAEACVVICVQNSYARSNLFQKNALSGYRSLYVFRIGNIRIAPFPSSNSITRSSLRNEAKFGGSVHTCKIAIVLHKILSKFSFTGAFSITGEVAALVILRAGRRRRVEREIQSGLPMVTPAEQHQAVLGPDVDRAPQEHAHLLDVSGGRRTVDDRQHDTIMQLKPELNRHKILLIRSKLISFTRERSADSSANARCAIDSRKPTGRKGKKRQRHPSSNMCKCRAQDQLEEHLHQIVIDFPMANDVQRYLSFIVSHVWIGARCSAAVPRSKLCDRLPVPGAMACLRKLSWASTSTGISKSSQILNNIFIKLSLSSSLLQITCRAVDPSASVTFGSAPALSSNSTDRFDSSTTVTRSDARSDASWASKSNSCKISWSDSWYLPLTRTSAMCNGVLSSESCALTCTGVLMFLQVSKKFCIKPTSLAQIRCKGVDF